MSAYRETKLHGTHGFPYIVYLGIIPEYTGGVALHWHEEMEIIYVTEGTVQVSVRQSDHVLSNGDIVLVHPQTIHAIRQYGESSARYYNITQGVRSISALRRITRFTSFKLPTALQKRKHMTASFAFAGIDNLVKKIIITNDDIDYSTSTVYHCKFKDFVMLNSLDEI